MSKRSLKNVPASIYQRLRNIAQDTGRPFDEVLQYFAMERFLYRLGSSKHAGSFVLKGALLFRVWDTPDTRATRDIDFLAYTDNSPDKLAKVIADTCSIEYEDDGLVFDPESVEAQRIKEDADYEGVRIRFRGYLGKARIYMQVDVGFGDTIHPEATQADYPTLLELDAPRLRVYSAESVVAEKAQAMVYLGSLNSRMKDFYDISRMSRQFDFDGATLGEAVQSTFNNRGTSIVEFEEVAVELREKKDIGKQWEAFLNKSEVDGPATFPDVLTAVGDFLAPVFSSIKSGHPMSARWTAPGPWGD